MNRYTPIVLGIKIIFFLNITTRVSGQADKQKDPDEPSARKLRRAQANSSLESVSDEIGDEQASTSMGDAPEGASIQLQTYLRETTASWEDKPLQY